VHILLVEDDHRLATLLARRLGREGYDATPTFTGTDGLEQASSGKFDLVVVDVMLPGMDGVTLTSTLREHGHHVPVLMLTARDSVSDRVNGLRSGADDYLVKPFAFAELLARLRALLRREVSSRDLFLRADDLEVDLLARRVVRGGV